MVALDFSTVLSEDKYVKALPSKTDQQLAQEQEDLKTLLRLNRDNLPSICCYTFFNTDHKFVFLLEPLSSLSQASSDFTFPDLLHQSMNCVDVSRDCTQVAAGFGDSSIKIWNVEESHSSLFGIPDSRSLGAQKRKRSEFEQFMPLTAIDESPYDLLLGHSGPVYATNFSSDNRFLLSCSEDNTVRLWSLETRSNLVAYHGHSHPVWDVCWGSNGYYFASTSHDRTACLWATEFATPLRFFVGHLSDVDVSRFSYSFSLCDQPAHHLFLLFHLQNIRMIVDDQTVKFHPNNLYVATGSSDKTIRMWDILSGNCVRIFTGHQGPITALAFSPDGKYLASGSKDHKIILWDISSGKKVRSLYG